MDDRPTNKRHLTLTYGVSSEADVDAVVTKLRALLEREGIQATVERVSPGSTVEAPSSNRSSS